jgi:hypothetical protein
MNGMRRRNNSSLKVCSWFEVCAGCVCVKLGHENYEYFEGAVGFNPNNPLEITGHHSWPKRCKPGSIAA